MTTFLTFSGLLLRESENLLSARPDAFPAVMSLRHGNVSPAPAVALTAAANGFRARNIKSFVSVQIFEIFLRTGRPLLMFLFQRAKGIQSFDE